MISYKTIIKNRTLDEFEKVSKSQEKKEINKQEDEQTHTQEQMPQM